MLLALLVFLGSAMPAGGVAAKADASAKTETVEQYTPADGRVGAAATELDAQGDWGDLTPFDSFASPAVRCDNTVSGSTAKVDLHVVTPNIYEAPLYHAVYPGYLQTVSLQLRVYEVLPNGADLQLVALSNVASALAGFDSPAILPNIALTDAPLGPTYKVAVAVVWFDFDDQTVSGSRLYGIDYYRSTLTTSSGTTTQPVAGACSSPVKAAASMAPVLGKVGTKPTYAIAYFPIDVPVAVRLDGRSRATVQTDLYGTAGGTFSVPSATLGRHTVTWTAGTAWSVAQTFTVTSSISAKPSAAARGASVTFSLRGYAAGETVLIRWWSGSAYRTVGSVTTSSSGSASITLPVPSWAPLGKDTVHGDGPKGKAKLNLTVTGVTAAARTARTATPTPASTPTATAAPAASPTATPEASATASPPATETPSATAEPTGTPTAEPTSTPEPTPTEIAVATEEPAVTPGA